MLCVSFHRGDKVRRAALPPTPDSYWFRTDEGIQHGTTGVVDDVAPFRENQDAANVWAVWVKWDGELLNLPYRQQHLDRLERVADRVQAERKESA